MHVTTKRTEPAARPATRAVGRTPAKASGPERSRYAFLRCWCMELSGTPRPECRDCGGGGMALARFPAPAQE